jgi:hypothetical protein
MIMGVSGHPRDGPDDLNLIISTGTDGAGFLFERRRLRFGGHVVPRRHIVDCEAELERYLGVE